MHAIKLALVAMLIFGAIITSGMPASADGRNCNGNVWASINARVYCDGADTTDDCGDPVAGNKACHGTKEDEGKHECRANPGAPAGRCLQVNGPAEKTTVPAASTWALAALAGTLMALSLWKRAQGASAA